MKIQDYIKQKKRFYEALIEFLDSEDDNNLNQDAVLIAIFDNQKKEKDSEEFKSILRLIVQISHNHHRNAFFNKKIEQILNYLSILMKEILTNSEIFNIFKSNRMILLYFIKSKIITLDKSMIRFIYNNLVYRHFFYPEIKSHITTKEEKKINKKLITDDFETKRQKGENESFICELIRNDSIEEFISYINQNNIQLSSTKINPSIFETNAFLSGKKLELIEYATFFGSIQIFKYLLNNDVKLTPSLWLYAIHSNNPEIIQILIDNQIKPSDVSYEECFYEAIKCHHNSIAQYIDDNMCNSNYLTDNLNDKTIDCILRYYNYFYFPENVCQQSLFFNLCIYDHLKIVNFIIETKKDEFEREMIFYLHY